MTVDRSNCWSCNAPMLWGIVPGTGKRMPLDAEPSEDGNVWIDPDTGEVEVVTGMFRLDDDRPLRLPHFATCPYGDAWRGHARARGLPIPDEQDQP